MGGAGKETGCQALNPQESLRQHLGFVHLPLTRSDFFAHSFQPRATIRVRIPVVEHPEAFVCDIEDSEEEELGESEEDEGPSCPARQATRPSRLQRSAGCSRWCDKYCCMVPTCDASSWQQGRLFIHVYRLDNYSRVIFPVTFFFFNVIYWLVCLNL